MKGLINAFFTLALISLPALAQTSGGQTACRLSEVPNIRGVRLGLTTNELLALFPGSASRKEIKEAIEEAAKQGSGGTAQLLFLPASFPNSEKFARIDAVSALLRGGRLVGFSITCIGPASNGPTWRNVDEWIAKLAESFNLPGAQSWTSFSEESHSKVLKCSGFDIEASAAGGTGIINIRSIPTPKEDDQNAEQERKRREFKP